MAKNLKIIIRKEVSKLFDAILDSMDHETEESVEIAYINTAVRLLDLYNNEITVDQFISHTHPVENVEYYSNLLRE